MPERRRVVVTGANSGIGACTVTRLAGAGFDVVGTVRSDEKAERVRREASAAGLLVRTAVLDVTDADAGRALITREAPWALVNNAGYAEAGAIQDVSDDEAHDQMETLVFAPARLARSAIGGMKAAGGGRIVNVSSIVAEVSSPLMGWYQAAKRALEGVSDAMRAEVAAAGIEVVLIQPGVIRTPIWDDVRHRLERRGPTDVAAAQRRWARLTGVLERSMSSPEAVARAIEVALTVPSPRARYPVGLDARILSRATRYVPTPWVDAATRALLDLNRR